MEYLKRFNTRLKSLVSLAQKPKMPKEAPCATETETVQKVMEARDSISRLLFLKGKKTVKKPGFKPRATAIRAGIVPGLYVKGRWVDSLESSIDYVVEELEGAQDQDYYDSSFFTSSTGEKDSLDLSRRVTAILDMIEEELV